MKRIGKCNRCGACCIVTKIVGGADLETFGDFGKPCKNLIIKNGEASCKIYKNRWPECREHPRDPLSAVDTCGFKFIISPEEAQWLFNKYRIEITAEDFNKEQQGLDKGEIGDYNGKQKNDLSHGNTKGSAK